jgi:hypothetical protein
MGWITEPVMALTLNDLGQKRRGGQTGTGSP